MALIDKLEKGLAWARALQQPAPVSLHHTRAVAELWPWIARLGIRNALEVGCGEPPGLIIAMLRSHGIDAIGLDGLSICDVPGDMLDLPFGDKTFDLVCSRHSLEHVLIPYLALMEMIRVSRRWLLVVVPMDSQKSLTWPDHLNVYGRGGWELIFERLGLVRVRHETGNHAEEGAPWPDDEWRWLLEHG